MSNQDNHQWLEQVDSKESLDWVQAQNNVTQSHFVKSEKLASLEAEALKIMDNKDRIPMIQIQGKYVYNFWTDNKNPRGLYRRTSFESYKTSKPNWEIVLDVDKLNKVENKSWVYRGCAFYKPDSKTCLMFLSDAGRDASEMREFDLTTKKFVQDGFFLPIGKNRVAWVDENTLLVAVDSDPATVSSSGYPLHVQYWKRNTDLKAAPVIFKAQPTDMTVGFYSKCRPEGCTVIIERVINFFQVESYFFNGPDQLSKLDLPMVYQIEGVWKNEFYISLLKDLNLPGQSYPAGSVLKAPIGQWTNLTSVFAPTPKNSFQSIAFSRDHLFLSVLENVVPKVYRDGFVAPIKDIGNTTLAEVDENSNQTLLMFESPLTPPTLLEWKKNQLITLKKMPSLFDSSRLKVEQLEATSKDGTTVPYFLIRSIYSRGPGPTIISAYGGFQVPMVPSYESIRGKLWLENGGQYVLANIRGGGEFGPRWHEAALKNKRQNAFDDLFAVTEDLFEKGLTTSSRTGFVGGSNGGLLAGVAYTQRPDLFKAIISQVPLLDMKRYHKLLAGASWTAEYGNPDDPKDWDYISKYSPYQNIKSETQYPSMFLMTSTRDDRVHPGHARKFAAKLQEKKIPFHYFENTEGGHGAAADLKQRARYVALQYAYFLEQLQ